MNLTKIQAMNSTPAAPGPLLAIDPLDHIKMVEFIARRYRRRGIDHEDLVQEGMIGLIESCRTFRPEDGFQFSTLAYVAIRRSIWTAVTASGRPVRVPEKVYTSVIRIRKGQDRRDDLAPGPRSQVEDAERLLARGVSRIPEAIPDRHDKRQHREASEESRAHARACLEVLGPRDRALVAAVHGIGTERRTFAQLAVEMGTPRQNVRGYYLRALNLIRRHFDAAPRSSDGRRASSIREGG